MTIIIITIIIIMIMIIIIMIKIRVLMANIDNKRIVMQGLFTVSK